MRIAKRAGIIFVLLMMFSLAGYPVVAQNVSSQWFPETRHTVSGIFFNFFYSVKDPLTQFGYPITDVIRDTTGRQTQYFQRARFDLVITDKGPIIQLADLGRYLYEDIGAAYNIVQTGPLCRPFPATGKTVCYDFLTFYDAHQGDLYIGDPITGIELRDGHYMQYFTKGRLEYDFTLPEGRRVVISQLGRPAFDKYVGNPCFLWGACNENEIDAIPLSAQVDAITARAFVRDPLLAPGQQQTIYLIVQNQNLLPVKGAQVSILALYPDGKKSAYRPVDLTAADGILKISLPVSRLDPGQVVELRFSVEFQGLKTTTNTWFRIWY